MVESDWLWASTPTVPMAKRPELVPGAALEKSTKVQLWVVFQKGSVQSTAEGVVSARG
jgi:hypothetical protein